VLRLVLSLEVAGVAAVAKLAQRPIGTPRHSMKEGTRARTGAAFDAGNILVSTATSTRECTMCV
jgi:hypothetical protein